MSKKRQHRGLIQFVLLRGLAREARHWSVFPEELKSMFEAAGFSVRVDALDLPGAGRYSEMDSPLTISEITEFIREKYFELRHMQRKAGEAPAQETFLVAVSLGGMIASDWLERWPEDFRGSVLINTSFKGYSPIYNRLTINAIARLAGILKERDALKREERILEMVSNRPERRVQLATEWAAISQDRPMRPLNLARQLFAAARYQPLNESPQVPTLILGSLGDRMVSPKCSEEIAKRWKANFNQHPFAGHDLPTDEADWVSSQILSWYESLSKKVANDAHNLPS